ncbi:MAG TPA: hypothetical protein PLR41_03240, partial [Alphaproteobacteria bacterium]|nr:hypothetical protein [Alphaproteobacteria bacterium]
MNKAGMRDRSRERKQEGNQTMNKGLLRRLAQVSMLALAVGGLAVQAQAVDVKSIAIMTPEEPTDF